MLLPITTILLPIRDVRQLYLLTDGNRMRLLVPTTSLLTPTRAVAFIFVIGTECNFQFINRIAVEVGTSWELVTNSGDDGSFQFIVMRLISIQTFYQESWCLSENRYDLRIYDSYGMTD